ncbi:chalcone isomerase family protein [Vibrio sp. MEBiC08052]|uniref:chalcone isomerase family protein n=1 Tax=Vibrio sp. MEBiC08052 TaxID=1761910 RepID=UPI0018D228B6|nr:chalcone isomerase family protein [Vibrio sp. MEBiC08052]
MQTPHLTATLSLIAILWTATANGTEIQGTSSKPWTDWPIVGQATLSWLWFDIYSSQLRTPDGHYEQVQRDVAPHPLALELRYLRDISSKELLEETQAQWERLGYDTAQSDAWLTVLAEMMPSVKTGVRLAYVTDGRSGQLYYFPLQGQQRLLGKVENKQLNDAFLSIWLSPNAEYPKLRNQLIGMKP